MISLAGGAAEPASDDRREWPGVDVIVLSWRSPAKTAAALQALANCGYPNLRVVLVENGSGDGVAANVWAAFRRAFPAALHLDIGAEAAGETAMRAMLTAQPAACTVPLFIASSVNRGYSGGMNIGLHTVLHAERADYFWTVNCDTLVMPGAVHAMVERCEEDLSVGLCGPTNHVVRPTGVTEVLLPGGYRYHRLLARNEAIPMPEHDDRAGRDEVERKLDGIIGSAVFGTRRLLQDVGVFETDRFLYGEERELAVRARRAGFRLAWAPGAHVHNVQAGSMEGVAERTRSTVGRYLGARARVRYAMRHDRLVLPATVVIEAALAGREVLAGRPKLAWAGLIGMVDGVAGRHKYFTQLGPAQFPGTVRS